MPTNTLLSEGVRWAQTALQVRRRWQLQPTLAPELKTLGGGLGRMLA